MMSDLVGATIAGSIPSVLAGRAEYGVRAAQDDGVTRRVSANGAVALNVRASEGGVSATVSLPADLTPAEPSARIDARLNGVPLETWTLVPGAVRTVRYVWPHPQAAYLELRATGASGRPVPFVIEVPMGLPQHEK
jgi:hypothetical protein